MVVFVGGFCGFCVAVFAGVFCGFCVAVFVWFLVFWPF